MSNPTTATAPTSRLPRSWSNVPMKALTVWQPWASWIAHDGKDIENRPWKTHYRGPVAIHAGKTLDKPMLRYLKAEGLPVPDMPTGVIVAVSHIVGVHQSGPACAQTHCSEWGEPVDDIYHWVLAGTQPISPIPCAGAQGLWTPSPQLRESITTHMAETAAAEPATTY